nr:hypothetical protein [Tanacetum cinerariifolium]
MDLFDFIHAPDPTKVRIVEREQDEDEPQLLEITVGRTVPLLPVAPDRVESDLEASVDRLFDEGVSGHQTEKRDFTRGGQDANIQLIVEVADTIVEDAAPMQLKSGKSRSALQRLLVGAVLNAEVGVTVAPTLPFMTAFVSTMSKREDEDHIDVAEVDSLVSDFLVGGIRTVFNPESDLQKTYVPQWIMTNGSRLDDGRVYRKMVDEFAPSKFLASVHGMEHDQLFTEFNVRVARQMSLSAEVRMQAEYNVKERRRLKYVVEKKDKLLKDIDEEIENLKVHMLLKEAEAAEAILLRVEASNFETMEKSLQDEVNALKERNTILAKDRNSLDVKATGLEALAMNKERELTKLNVQLTAVKSQNDILVDQVHELEVSSTGIQEKLSSYESLMERLEEFQDAQLKIVNDKFDNLYANFMDMALYLEEKFYPHLLTTIFGRMWLFTHGMELSLVNCLHSPEYLSALGAAVSKAIEKGMQDGSSARIIHGKNGRVLKDVAAHNPSTKADYISALQQFQNLRLTELQPHVDQLIVPIHHPPDKVVIIPCDVFVPLAEPFSAVVLTGSEGTSNVMPTIADTTTALSVTLASASTIAPISVDDYEVMGTDDQAGADGNAEPFPNVDDA